MTNQSAPPVCLIDASIYIFRYYFSMPANWFSEPEGYATEAVYGFTGFLLGVLEKHGPARIAACFDESLGSGFRHQLYPGYKSSRALPDEALAFQLAACRQVAQLLGIRCFASPTYEADDLLASLYRVCVAEQVPVAVLTRDKDLGQILRRNRDFLWDYGADARHFRDDIEARFGVPCERLVDYQALVGDTVDDIPGVPGIGPKTAAALLRHADLDELLRCPEAVATLPVRGGAALAGKLADYREQIQLSRRLAALVGDLEILQSSDQLRRLNVNFGEVSDFCRKMGWPGGVAERVRRVAGPYIE